MALKLPFVVSLLLVTLKENRATEGNDWSYQGATGPDAWSTNYPDCGASLQTPIDLPATENLTPEASAPLTLEKYTNIPTTQLLVHDGWSAKLLGTYKVMPYISGGLLNDTYEFKQLHFHWGENDTVGSEHTINSTASPLEIHFVHESSSGTLAVLGVMTYFNDTNPRGSVLFPLWKCFINNEKNNQACHLRGRDRIRIDDLLPSSSSRFYRYVGSTTTPPCLANVTWTVFEDKVPISRADVALLRTWIGKDNKLLLKNYRPIQATESREILLVSQ